MKKTATIFLGIFLVIALTACGGSKEAQQEAQITDSLELLNTVWNTYGEEEKFPVAGGDFSEENQNMEGPGKYALTDAEALDASLGFPADSIDQIDDAASLMHMMNANTFTCGAYHVKDSRQITTLADAIKDNILKRLWTCGFPDKFFVVSVDDYIVAFFGKEDAANGFRSKLAEAYPNARVIYEETIE